MHQQPENLGCFRDGSIVDFSPKKIILWSLSSVAESEGLDLTVGIPYGADPAGTPLKPQLWLRFRPIFHI